MTREQKMKAAVRNQRKRARICRALRVAVTAAGALCAWRGGSLIVGNLLGGDRLWQMLAVLYAAGLLAAFADWLAELERKGGKRRDMV